jgi:hypothetical protein
LGLLTLRFSCAVLSVLAVTELRATTPPPLPNMPPPLFGGVVPKMPPFRVPPAALRRHMTLQELDALQLSGTFHFILRSEILHDSLSSTTASIESDGTSDESAAAEAATTDSAGRRHRFFTEAEAIAGIVDYSRNMTIDNVGSDQFVEPTITAVGAPGNATVTVAARLTNAGGINVSRLYFARTPDQVNVTNRGELPLPAGYQHSADPYLTINPYAGGDSPQTIWCSGLVHNGNASQSVALWRSVDSGMAWGVTPVATSVNPDPQGRTWLLDKPHAAVNWNQNYLGRIYVAYGRVCFNCAQDSEIHLARIRTKLVNGVPTVTVDSDIVVATNNVNYPQVVINKLGKIFVVYRSFAERSLRMATVLDSTTGPLTVLNNTTERIVDFANKDISTATLIHGIRAGTVPFARYNWTLDRIEVAWHQSQQANSLTPSSDAYYTSAPAAFGQAWPLPVAIAADPSTDEMLPAFDVNTAGDVLYTYVHRPVAPVGGAESRYVVKFRTKPVTGAASSGTVPDELGNTFGYLPSAQPVDPGFLGDYQDVWNWTFSGVPRFFGAWIKSELQSDVIMSGIR